MISDGVLVSTPAGSTAYNLSVHGPILSLHSKKLSIAPISPLDQEDGKEIVNDKLKIEITNLNPSKRPISAVADNQEVRNAKSIVIKTKNKIKFNLLYDKNRSLQKKIKIEQLRKRNQLKDNNLKLKIAINIKNINNSYGGGNQFLNCLTSHLKKKKFIIKNNLQDSDIDIILLIDPRSRHPLSNFTIGQIFRYVKYKNPNALVVHRVNECDERKNTNFMNKLLKFSNNIADHTVFTSRWLKKLDVSQKGPSSLIYNGPDKVIFYPRKYKKIYPPYKIITHHWSDNWMKGFDTYKKIDDLINRKFWNKRFNLHI